MFCHGESSKIWHFWRTQRPSPWSFGGNRLSKRAKRPAFRPVCSFGPRPAFMGVKDCFSDIVFEGKNTKLQSCVFCVGWIFGVIWVLLFSFLRTTPGHQTVWKKKDELRCFWGTRLRSTFRKKQSHNHNQGGWVAKMVCGRFLVCCCVKETILKPKNGLKKAKKTAFCLESILAFF